MKRPNMHYTESLPHSPPFRHRKRCHGAQNKMTMKAAIRGLVPAWSLGGAESRQLTSSPVASSKLRKELVEELDNSQADQCEAG